MALHERYICYTVLSNLDDLKFPGWLILLRQSRQSCANACVMHCEQRVLQLKMKVHPLRFTECIRPQSFFGGFWLFFNHFDRQAGGRRTGRRQYIRFCITLNTGFTQTGNGLENSQRKLARKPAAGSSHPSSGTVTVKPSPLPPSVQPRVARKRPLARPAIRTTTIAQLSGAIADVQPRVRETASRQRARRMAASSREMAGSKVRAACQKTPTSAAERHTPAWRPAR